MTRASIFMSGVKEEKRRYGYFYIYEKGSSKGVVNCRYEVRKCEIKFIYDGASCLFFSKIFDIDELRSRYSVIIYSDSRCRNALAVSQIEYTGTGFTHKTNFIAEQDNYGMRMILRVIHYLVFEIIIADSIPKNMEGKTEQRWFLGIDDFLFQKIFPDKYMNLGHVICEVKDLLQK